jgi:hypothetical protein
VRILADSYDDLTAHFYIELRYVWLASEFRERSTGDHELKRIVDKRSIVLEVTLAFARFNATLSFAVTGVGGIHALTVSIVRSPYLQTIKLPFGRTVAQNSHSSKVSTGA